jgi:hypothetical protein
MISRINKKSSSGLECATKLIRVAEPQRPKVSPHACLILTTLLVNKFDL